MSVKNKMNYIGIIILVSIFLVFYLVSNLVLSRRVTDPVVDNTMDTNINFNDEDYSYEEGIISNLYEDMRILYDVVNNKFKVSQEDTIVINDIVYKKITNFDEVIYAVFTENGKNKYINDLKQYFAYTDEGYYLAGNLVSYQTYYFRGDKTNIYVLDSNEEEINAIIYERWTSSNRDTLATVRLVNENDTWLIDEVSIKASE